MNILKWTLVARKGSMKRESMEGAYMRVIIQHSPESECQVSSSVIINHGILTKHSVSLDLSFPLIY